LLDGFVVFVSCWIKQDEAKEEKVVDTSLCVCLDG